MVARMNRAARRKQIESGKSWRAVAEKRELAAVRLCRRFDLPLTTMKYRDYRYWQARRCAIDVEIDEGWTWWKGLHWMTRENMVRRSPYYLVRMCWNKPGRRSAA